MINAGQMGAVGAAFKLAGYEGPLLVAPVTSEDERFFLLDAHGLEALRDVRALEQVLQQLLGRKVAVVQRDDPGHIHPFRGLTVVSAEPRVQLRKAALTAP